MIWLQPATLVLLFFGGVVVYRWQRETDRLTELAKERRETYRDFLEAIDDYMAVFFGPDEEARRVGYSRFRVAKRKLILVASSWVLKAVEAHGQALADCRSVMMGEKNGLKEDV